jgi:hypothetical protein
MYSRSCGGCGHEGNGVPGCSEGEMCAPTV